MSQLNPDKLHIKFADGAQPGLFALPRAYTLTHSDTSGDLFLTIGNGYVRSQISGFYTRWMRDEVLAEWSVADGRYMLHLYCHVSGGFVLGPAGWRLHIFRRHLPLVMQALRHGDVGIYDAKPALDKAEVFVHFKASQARYNLVEDWGKMGDYQVGAP